MKARVLLTNGNVTTKLLWIEQRAKDIYYGHSGTPGHISYHESGEHHHTDNARNHSDISMRVPLNEIQGVVPLTALNFRNRPNIFTSRKGRLYDPSKKKSRSDALLMVDSRTIPDDRQVIIWLGLLEAGNGKALGDFLVERRKSDLAEDHHLILTVTGSVWIWALLSWVSESYQQLGDKLSAEHQEGPQTN